MHSLVTLLSIVFYTAGLLTRLELLQQRRICTITDTAATDWTMCDSLFRQILPRRKFHDILTIKSSRHRQVLESSMLYFISSIGVLVDFA